MTELQKMLSGELYDPLDFELTAARKKCRDLTKRLNDSAEDEVYVRKADIERAVRV